MSRSLACGAFALAATFFGGCAHADPDGAPDRCHWESGGGTGFVLMCPDLQGRPTQARLPEGFDERTVDAAKAGDSKAMTALGEFYADGPEALRDYPRALDLLNRAADAGDGDAMAKLGALYQQGLGVTEDDAQAVRWLRKAADNGHVPAMVSLGLAYASGKGVARDDGEAMHWYRAAAAKGNAYGKVNVIAMYNQGLGVGPDPNGAVGWLKAAAGRGDAEAMTSLGDRFAHNLPPAVLNSPAGEIGPKDIAEALHWYKMAVEQSEPGAMNALGVLYLQGRDVPKDEAAAVQLFRRSADAGWFMADYNLALCYLQGLGGLPRDSAQAARLLELAKRHGVAQATSLLASMPASLRGEVESDPGKLTWASTPSEYELGLAFPPAAAAAGVLSGRTLFTCRIGADSSLVDCKLAFEQPQGYAFGEAGLKLMAKFRPSFGMAQGSLVTVPIRFTFEPWDATPEFVDTCAAFGEALSKTMSLSGWGAWYNSYWAIRSERQAAANKESLTSDRLMAIRARAAQDVTGGKQSRRAGWVAQCGFDL
jgi:TPR repeat protein